MSKPIELRLTKTEFEKLLTAVVLSDFMQNFKSLRNSGDQQFIKILLLIAEMNNLSDYVTRVDGELVVTDKIVNKMSKILYHYKDVEKEMQPLLNQKKKKNA